MEPVALPASQIEIDQTITWLREGRLSNLFTLGQPISFIYPVQIHFRPFDDVERVSNPTEFHPPSYQANSVLIKRNSLSLNQLSMEPDLFENPEFYARYTALPSSTPERVIALAEQVTAEATSPYEQALLLEKFLRQYPYNLDIPALPENVDPVDYFLFDLQEGYCDLYASSMVIMARSLGLPARLGVGFLNPSQPRPDGQYLITQDLGHSWAEIYFPEVGWIEFEPTATFPIFVNPDSIAQVEVEPEPVSDLPELPDNPSLPEEETPLEISGWIYLFATLILGWIGMIIGRWVQRRNEPTTTSEVFGRIRRFGEQIGYPLQTHQTVKEFLVGLEAFVHRMLAERPDLIDETALIRNIKGVTEIYEVELYGKQQNANLSTNRVMGAWLTIKRPMRRLIWERRWQDVVDSIYRRR